MDLGHVAESILICFEQSRLSSRPRNPLVEQVFREDLRRWARNGWSLHGLEQSLRTQGRTQQADDVHRQLTEAWSRADVKLDLAWF